MESRVSINLRKNWQRLCFDIVFCDIAPLLIQNKVITVDEYQMIVSQPQDSCVDYLLILLLRKDEEVMLKFVKTLERDYKWLAEELKKGYAQETVTDEVDATPITRLRSDGETENDTLTEDEKSVNGVCYAYHSLNNIEERRNNLNNSLNNHNGLLGRRKILKSKVKNKKKPKIKSVETVVPPTPELIKPVQNEDVTDEVITIIRKNSLVSRSWTTLAHSLGLTDRVNEIRFKVVLHGEDLSMCLVYLIKDWIEMFPKMAKLSKLIEVLRSEGFNSVADKLTEILYKEQTGVTNSV